MTPEQKQELRRLVGEVIRTSEELGAVPSSLYWNAAYFKQQAAEDALRKFIDEL